MIFIAVGTQKFQLNRLLKQIDQLIKENKITDDNVFAQTGNSDYIPQNYKYEKFLCKEDFEKYIRECSLLITHSGVGTIITGKKYNKPVIVYPRLKKFNEHVDDHQLQIAEAFSKLNFVLMCNENDNLESLIDKSQTYKFEKYISNREHIISEINSYLESLL